MALVGQGTTVELWLPIIQGVQSSEDSVRFASLAIETRGRALLVNDEELARMSTADMLIDLGYEVLEAESAEEALRLLNGGTA
jgi:PleD family two-component response regulator